MAYVSSGYVETGYIQEGISVNKTTYVITVPQTLLTNISGQVYTLDTNAFRIALKDWEDGPDGIVMPQTHNHNTLVTLGGIQYARVIEILSPYTITFEETGTPYVVTLTGSNNNILEKTNLGSVQILSNNSAGLINVQEIQFAAFEGAVAIDVINGEAGVVYPIGTPTRPVNNIADALVIAKGRGFSTFNVVGNLTIPSGVNVSAYRFNGQGSTLNSPRTTITMEQGCITSNAQWHFCKITGYQGGESVYDNCTIDGIENAHCIYRDCGFMDGTTLGYTIKQSNAVGSGHASYYKNCFSDEGTAIIDRNGAKMNVTIDGWNGRLKIINQNHATSSGQMWIHLNGGTIIVDNSCTKGKITVTGFGTLFNSSVGTEVDASGFASENYQQLSLTVESLRDTHQAFGQKFFVDPVNGNDASPGTSPLSPKKTVTSAMGVAVSGRGDTIYLMAPGETTANIDERIVVNKEDLHFRGPGRGIQFQPSTPDLGDVITVDSNNCSFRGFIVRAPAGSTTDNCITINGKFTEFQKLYLVGTQIGSGNGFLFRGGDYHELHDCESEKMGGSGLKCADGLLGSGSPREITIQGGNYYLNNMDGIELTGNPGNPTNSTRIIRIKGANIHDNLRYGLSADANSTRIVLDSDTTIHSNVVEEIYNLSPSLQQFSDRDLITQVKYRVESLRKTHQAFGKEFFVDPANGNDASVGTTDFNPFKTLAKAVDACVSGRGDVIYLLGPSTGTATIPERIVITKEDVHIRGPGRGVQIQPPPENANNGAIIEVVGNNCSFAGFIIRAPVGSTTDDGMVISGKFSRTEKIYIVGPGQTVGTGRGIVFTGGDYHELYDMEIEKFGDSGIELDDKSDTHSNGSPREITISGGNIYLNGEHGICLHGKTGAALGATSRIIRLLNSCNIHDNLSYGIHTDANVLGVVLDSSVILHNNNGGDANPQLYFEGTYFDQRVSTIQKQTDSVWGSQASNYNVSGSFGAIFKKLLTVAKYIGLK